MSLFRMDSGHRAHQAPRYLERRPMPWITSSTSQYGLARCDSCGLPLLGSMLETLQDVVGLPDALVAHACECGHPEMRRLPDGVFHCPACGSEVLPIGARVADTRRKDHRWSAT